MSFQAASLAVRSQFCLGFPLLLLIFPVHFLLAASSTHPLREPVGGARYEGYLPEWITIFSSEYMSEQFDLHFPMILREGPHHSGAIKSYSFGSCFVDKKVCVLSFEVWVL